MNNQEVMALLKALSRIGGPLASALNIPELGQATGGAGGALNLAGGVMSGNPIQAISGAAGLGSNAAKLAGFSDVGGMLGNIAGPLAFGAGLASGNPGAAIGALPSTISAGANLGSSLGLIAPQLANSIAGSMSALALPAMFIAMSATAEQNGGQDLFDSLFGGAKSQAQKQMEEYKDYAARFPGLVEDRARGASLLDSLATMAPEQLGDALATATKGIRATDLAPARDHLAQPAHRGKSNLAADIPGIDMSGWDAVAPELEGKNWASFLGLLDRATNAGLDVNSIAGDRERQMSPGRGHVFQDASGNNVEFDPGIKYNQSSYDISNALAGIGGQLGINWGARGDERAGENQGYTLYDDQLAGYGFTPGNQSAAALKYLSKLDPNVMSNPNWQVYKDKLGVTDEQLNAIPDYQIETRNKLQTPAMFATPSVSDGGGGPA